MKRRRGEEWLGSGCVNMETQTLPRVQFHEIAIKTQSNGTVIMSLWSPKSRIFQENYENLQEGEKADLFT
jgi:hypothetical protein